MQNGTARCYISDTTPYTLSPGMHKFRLEFTTGDPLYHVGAYYELNLVFNPVF